MARWEIRGTQGSYTPAELQVMAANGRIQHDTEVRPRGKDKWYRASKVQGLFSGDSLNESLVPPLRDDTYRIRPISTATRYCPSCGKEALPGEQQCSKCMESEIDHDAPLASCPQCQRPLMLGCLVCPGCQYDLATESPKSPGVVRIAKPHPTFEGLQSVSDADREEVSRGTLSGTPDSAASKPLTADPNATMEVHCWNCGGPMRIPLTECGLVRHCLRSNSVIHLPALTDDLIRSLPRPRKRSRLSEVDESIDPTPITPSDRLAMICGLFACYTIAILCCFFPAVTDIRGFTITTRRWYYPLFWESNYLPVNMIPGAILVVLLVCQLCVIGFVGRTDRIDQLVRMLAVWICAIGAVLVGAVFSLAHAHAFVAASIPSGPYAIRISTPGIYTWFTRFSWIHWNAYVLILSLVLSGIFAVRLIPGIRTSNKAFRTPEGLAICVAFGLGAGAISGFFVSVGFESGFSLGFGVAAGLGFWLLLINRSQLQNQ